jgi:hypothetical protein
VDGRHHRRSAGVEHEDGRTDVTQNGGGGGALGDVRGDDADAESALQLVEPGGVAGHDGDMGLPCDERAATMPSPASVTRRTIRTTERMRRSRVFYGAGALGAGALGAGAFGHGSVAEARAVTATYTRR